ncbi:MAG: NYN domain-containing protein [Planctomycetes bacterium]|nr:NYN domain-containing protein [Planctomycetota bacterium]
MGGRLRVLIAVDEANLVGVARTVNKRLDWLHIREYLASEDEGRELVECIAYVGLPPAAEEFADRRNKKMGFILWLRNHGFMVLEKEGVRQEAGHYRANVDVLMAIDFLDLVETTHPDVVVMVTGDSDFAYLADRLRRRGIRVEVASIDQCVSRQLRAAASDFIDLRDILNEAQDLNGNGRTRIGTADILEEEYAT